MKRTKSGFTIVELLVVIVVIAVLAAIVIISYTGIRQRAIVSSLQSDLSSASTQLKLYQVINNAYPTSNDCSSGPNPAPPKICLKTSSGNSYINYVVDNGNPQTFCIAEDNNGITYKATSGVGATAGRCSAVTSSPINLIANGGTAQIVLNWTAPSDDGGSAITGYKVYRGASAGSETLLTTIGNVLTYTNTGLSTGTTYYYQVTAINGTGESSYSNEASDVTNPITYTLTTIAGAGGTVSSGGTYNTGSTPTITATPNVNYAFSSWTGDTGCSGIASHTITMDANKSCTANFVGNLYYYNKYNATASHTYSSPGSFWRALSDYTVGIGTQGYTGYAFNSSVGFYMTGSLVNMSSGTTYLSGGSNLQRYTYLSQDATNYHVNVDFESATDTVVYSQGTLVASNITAIDGTYPNNGYYSTDGYWYVKGAKAN